MHDVSVNFGLQCFFYVRYLMWQRLVFRFISFYLYLLHYRMMNRKTFINRYIRRDVILLLILKIILLKDRRNKKGHLIRFWGRWLNCLVACENKLQQFGLIVSQVGTHASSTKLPRRQIQMRIVQKGGTTMTNSNGHTRLPPLV